VVRLHPVNSTATKPSKTHNMAYFQEFNITTAIFLASAAAIAYLAIKDRKPRESLDPPLIPTVPLLLVLTVVALLALVHDINLLGVHTGR
jgi:hypothetical protein